MNSNEFVMMNSGFNLCDKNLCKWVRKRMSSISDIFNIEKIDAKLFNVISIEYIYDN